MMTHREQLDRFMEVARDAFEGGPAYMEPESDHVWTGTVPTLHLKLLFSPGFPEPGAPKGSQPIASGQAILHPNNPKLLRILSSAAFPDLRALETWAYGLSRQLKAQQFITPRHFHHLVQTTLDTDESYHANWPHEHRIILSKRRAGQFKEIQEHLTYRWDEEACCITAVLNEFDPEVGYVGEEPILIRSPDDAIGLLSLLADGRLTEP